MNRIILENSGNGHRAAMLLCPELLQQLKIRLALFPCDGAGHFFGALRQCHLADLTGLLRIWVNVRNEPTPGSLWQSKQLAMIAPLSTESAFFWPR